MVVNATRISIQHVGRRNKGANISIMNMEIIGEKKKAGRKVWEWYERMCNDANKGKSDN